jgi:uncharacterized protein with HEPN domain
MRPKRVYVDYLRDIESAAEKAQRFTEGMNFSSFAADEKTVQEDIPLLRSAVSHVLAQIEE